MSDVNKKSFFESRAHDCFFFIISICIRNAHCTILLVNTYIVNIISSLDKKNFNRIHLLKKYNLLVLKRNKILSFIYIFFDKYRNIYKGKLDKTEIIQIL